MLKTPKVNRSSKGDKSLARPFDRCQTPGYAVGPLLENLDPEWAVWECAAGEGMLADALRERCARVIESDVVTGQNFFEYEPPAWDVIVTNPPFSLKFDWLERCYDLGKPFALLLPVETLGAAKAQRLFGELGLEVILLDKRVNFKMPNKGFEGGGAWFPVAWFTNGLRIGRTLTYAKLNIPGSKMSLQQAML